MTGLPHDANAERAILGACMMSDQTFDTTRPSLTAADFYDAQHQVLWTIYETLRDAGSTIDPVTIVDTGKLVGLTMIPADVLGIMVDAPSSQVQTRWVEIVLRCAVHRRVFGVAEDLRIKATDATMGADEILDLAQTLIGEIARPVAGGDVPGLSTIDDLIDRQTVREPWLIPGLFRRSWRAMLVAPEGAGKSYVGRALAIGAGQGLAPFGGKPFPPIRTLLIDAENPEDVVRETCRPIRDTAHMNAEDYAEHRTWIWHRPGGMNLRSRANRSELERVIAATQPDLVCAGPMYKLYRPGKDGDEQAALDVMILFDDLRTRYGFALLLEHHAPKAQGNVRELVPYGTSLWMRWLELGIKLAPSSDYAGSLDVGRFRPDRVPCSWPDRLDRGTQWPWSGYWANGMGEF